jgi:hypothetical protein
MRARGMRLVKIWVRDPTASGFAEECRRQSRSLLKGKGAEEEREVMKWIEQVSAIDD